MTDSAAAPAGPTTRWLAGILGGSVALFAAVYYASVWTRLGRQLASAAFRGADRVGTITSAQSESVLALISLTAVVAAIAAVTTIALVRLTRTTGLLAVGLLIGANLTTQVLKRVLPRPDLGLPEITPTGLNSLPSGHATAAFSIVAALLLVLPPRLRPGAAAIGIVASSSVAIATMPAGWHRASDAVAALLVVIAWAALVGLVAVKREPNRLALAYASAWTTNRWIRAGMSGLWLLVLTTVLLLSLDDPLRRSALGQLLAFAAAVVLIVAATIASTVVLVRLTERIGELPASPPSG